jgi:hypothetical protein
MLPPPALDAAARFLTAQLAAGGDAAAVRAAFETVAPHLTAVLKVLLRWPEVDFARHCDERCVPVGSTGGSAVRRVQLRLPWDLVSMRAAYASLAEILGRFNQVESV